jgi:hypothetical protein
MFLSRRLAIVKQLHDVLAEPEFLYAQALRSSRTPYAGGGLEGLDQVAQVIVSGIAKLAATDPFHYIYLLFQKPRADVTFQSLALAQTHPDDCTHALQDPTLHHVLSSAHVDYLLFIVCWLWVVGCQLVMRSFDWLWVVPGRRPRRPRAPRKTAPGSGTTPRTRCCESS